MGRRDWRVREEGKREEKNRVLRGEGSAEAAFYTFWGPTLI